MTMENTTENNILIAEFMGMTQGHPDPNETRWETDFFEKLIVDGNVFESGRRHTHLHFDHDFNWLMPVWNKISLLENVTQTSIRRSQMTREIEAFIEYRQKGFLKFYARDEKDGLLAMYNCIVEFIEWYNENK